MMSAGEKITVPVMNFILLTLLPLRLVRKTRFTSLSAANGQFMFYEREAYFKLIPHEKLKAEKVEDIAAARYFKSEGHKIACLTGDSSLRCRMYKNTEEAVQGFSKNIAAFFGNSLTVAALFWLITTLGFIPVMIYMPLKVFILYILAYIATRVTVSLASEQNSGENILLTIPQQIFMGLIIYRAFINKTAGKFEWKGRSIK
jgi:Flp pilus assembly protein TadB